jgi:4-amino-4-deoxy-L-arabinose transferase-like glycosyltransferase
MYTMMGLAVLAKGPVGFIVPCAIVGMFMLLMRLPPIDADFWQRQGWIVRIAAAMGRPFAPRHFLGTLWLMRPISLAAIVLAIAAPWYLAVGFQTMGDWPRSFFLNENLARAATSLESHQGGWWYYPLSIMLGFFPASVFFGPMLVRLDRQMTAGSQGAPATLLMVCWVGVQVGLFTLAKTKLPSYVTPSYPALALLTGAYLAKYSRRQFADGLRIDRWPAWGLLVSGVGIMVALAVVGHRFLEGSWQIGLMGVVLVAGAGLMLWLEGSGQSGMAANAYCGTAFLFAVSIFGWGTVTVDRHRQSQRVLEQVAHNPAPVFGTFNCLESSWVYYGGKPAFELTVDYQDGVWYDGRKHDWLKKDWPSPEQFARAYPEALIITTNEHVAELGLRLPQYEVLERARYFLKEQDMVVLGRRNPGAERSTNRRSDSRALR